MNAPDPNPIRRTVVSHDGPMKNSTPKISVLALSVTIALSLAVASLPAYADNAVTPGSSAAPATTPTASPLTTANPSPSPSQTSTASNSSSDAAIAQKLTQRWRNKAIGSDLAYVVMDANSQRVIASRNASKPMLPASNMKIITATNALATMSPTQTFTTAIFPGTTAGHVTLQGGGDPLLSKKNLKTLAMSLFAVVDHTQPLVIDTDLNLFPETTNGPGWTNGYIPSVVSPVNSLGLYGDYSRTPSTHAIDAFIGELNGLGVQASRGASVDVPSGAVALASISPHTVADAVHVMLLDSENNIAENLFRHVAIATGHPATWQGASDAAIASLNSLGINTTDLRLSDGSGVSRTDRLTAIALANVLRHVSTTDPARFAVMFDPGAMPTAGIDGTLKAKFHRYSTAPSSCAKGTIRAKTGTLHDTIALSGTTHDADGQLKVFSFLVNHRPTRVIPLRTRQAVDGLAATITGCW